MNTVCIVYRSLYHGNTENVVRILARHAQVDLIDLKDEPNPDLSAYKLVGLASGIYRGRMHRSLYRLVRRTRIDADSKTFVFYTSGLNDPAAGEGLLSILNEKGYESIGCWHCPGSCEIRRFSSEASQGHPDRRDVVRLFRLLRPILRFHLQ